MGSFDLVVSFQCPREVALQRYLGRRDQSRPDGDEKLFARRFGEFEVENAKVLDYYKNHSGRVIEVWMPKFLSSFASKILKTNS